MLAVAIILGLVSSLLVYNYMSQLNKKQQVNLVSVVVAEEDIPARVPITPAMVRIQQVPSETRHPAAFVKADEVVGKVTRQPITAGEQVLASKFGAQRGDSGLAFSIPSTQRAVAIKVTEQIGTGGLVIPGDHVDIIAVFDAKTMGKDMSALILQDVVVLAVAQRIEGEPAPASTSSQVAKRVGQIGQAEASDKELPKSNTTPQPEAKTVTLAVTPEQAQRLVLAEETGKLRLALRPYKEGATVDLPEATLSTVRAPLEGGRAQITSVSISPTNLKAGDSLEVQITVKNISDKPLKSQGPEPGFVYVQGQTFHSQGFPSQDGAFRVGLNLEGNNPINFPYRWGLGADLAPGASTTVKGYVKLAFDLKPTSFWAGLIEEPSSIQQDNAGTTLVTVLPTDKVIIAADVANVRSGPNISSSIVETVEKGKSLPVLGQQADWYKVKLESGKEGWVAAGWIVQPGSRPSAALGTQAGGSR